MSFEGDFKKTNGIIKSEAQKMISGDNDFLCLVVDICKRIQVQNGTEREDATVYPNTVDVVAWLKSAFDSKELKHKALPQKALANMKAKGITPKKQPAEILDIVICASETDVVFVVHNPTDKEKQIDVVKFVANAFSLPIDFIKEKMSKGNINNDYVFVYTADKEKETTPFKERDVLRNMFYSQMKKDGIYKDDESDDEVCFYDE
jgi:hypothetical protein